MATNFGRRQRIANIAEEPPRRRVLDDRGQQVMNKSGRPRVEKMPRLPSFKVVYPSGNVGHFVYATGRTLGGMDAASNPYFPRLWPEKVKAGTLRYAECPYATGALPTPRGEKPCTGDHPMVQEVVNEDYDSRKPESASNPRYRNVQLNTKGAFWKLNRYAPRFFDEPKTCHHMEKIIAERKAATRQRVELMADRFKSQTEKRHELETEILRGEIEAKTVGKAG